jgi:hypothetical protein
MARRPVAFLRHRSMIQAVVCVQVAPAIAALGDRGRVLATRSSSHRRVAEQRTTPNREVEEMRIPRRPATRLLLLSAMILALSLTAMLTGCSSDDPAAPAASTATVDQDAADAMAADLAADSGGVTDQIADLSTAIASLGAAKTVIHERFHETVWDDATGTWTITVSRERGDPAGTPYGSMSRTYTLRLLNAMGEPQQYRIVGADTARTAEFAIVSGTGLHRTLLREHTLDELTGAFTVTGVETDLLTVNGAYHRAASNRLETLRFVRTLTGALDVELSDVTVPRALGVDFGAAVSGTIAGTYVADITVTRGDEYRERHIERDVVIVLGNGEATINCGGGAFRALLGTGELAD